MAEAARTVRRSLASRGVVVLFGIQLNLLLVTFAEPFHGMRAVTAPVIAQAEFVNGFTDLLFAPGYAGLWDPSTTLLALPFVYYATAVVVAALGRSAARFGRRTAR